MKRYGLIWVLAGIVALTGCRTTPKPGPETPRVAAGQIVGFVPMSAAAALQFKEGAYPALLGGSSKALWLSPDIAPNAAAPGLLTIEITLESAFSDVSIAYDTVGLRGVDVYLLTPGGEKVHPAQSVVGGDLQEEAQGALKRFRRTDQLLFPPAALQVAVPRTPDEDTAMRLVLEGHETVFYFEWIPRLPEVNVPPKLSERDEVKAVRDKSKEAHKRFLKWSHKFD